MTIPLSHSKSLANLSWIKYLSLLSLQVYFRTIRCVSEKKVDTQLKA